MYYFHENTEKLEFICADEVAEDGTVSLAFTHASDYMIAIDEKQEENSNVTEPVKPEEQDDDSTEAAEEKPSDRAGVETVVVYCGRSVSAHHGNRLNSISLFLQCILKKYPLYNQQLRKAENI